MCELKEIYANHVSNWIQISGFKKNVIHINLKVVLFLQDSDGEKSDQDLVVDVANEVCIYKIYFMVWGSIIN